MRSGCGLWPIRRLNDRAPEGTHEAVRREALDVFTKARGEDGLEKRRNAQRLKIDFDDVWKEEGGKGWEELKRVFALIE